MIWLKELCKEDEIIFTQFEREYKSQCGAEKIPFSLNPENLTFDKFYECVRQLRYPSTCPQGYVPAVNYLVFNDDKVVGGINLRYRNNDFILKVAGNIGYGITPKERGKGFATEALTLCLFEALKFGLDTVVLTTDNDNKISQKVIEKNNGKLIGKSSKTIYEINLAETVSDEYSAMAVVVCGNSVLITEEDVYGKLRISLPKGHIEQGESAEDAAVRECFEETDVKICAEEKVCTLSPFITRFTDDKGRHVRKTITPVLYVKKDCGSPRAKEKRIKRAEFIDIKEFYQKSSYENVKDVVRQATETLKISF